MTSSLMLEKSLKERLLPAGLIVDEAIKDESCKSLYNYEVWLRELVNASEAFMRKTSGEQLRGPRDESHGEADAISSHYSIDFKLIAGKSMLCALREMSAEKTVMRSGVTLTHPSRKTGCMKAIWLHKALRLHSADDLRRLWDANPKRDLTDREDLEIAGFFKLLKKKKNLLLLYPALLYVDGDMAIDENDVSDAVYSDYRNALKLRQEYLPDYENYLAYLSYGRLVVLEVLGEGWRTFDSVPVSASKTFMKATRHYDLIDYAELDILLGQKRQV